MTVQPIEALLREKEDLRQRLEEAEDTIRALRAGEVDAVVIETDRPEVYTLEKVDRPYRLLVEQLPHAAATLSGDGTVLYSNRRFVELLQRPLLELLGRPFHEFLAPGSEDQLELLLRSDPQVQSGETLFLRRADGSSVPVFLGISAIEEGAHGLCLVVTDLSQQRHYVELQESQHVLQQSIADRMRAEAALLDAARNKDEFLATLAHELRNPLAPISNAVEILKIQGPESAELRWARGVIERQVRLMARLLEDLLDMSRISRNRLELRKEQVALAAVLDAALETSRPVIEAAGHQLSVLLSPEPIHLEADPVRLSQVFSNLLNNAAKYTERGGRIRLTAERSGSEVAVTVEDNGIGISPDLLPGIFGMFAQLSPEAARSQGGLGIGLSLVKGLVELHGGDIQAESAGPGQGSRFVVRLPALEAAVASAGPPQPDAAQATKPYRMLIVDDNQDHADSLAMLLRLAGHEVRTAYDGERAIEAAEAQRPEVVLLDLDLPKRDGYQVCRDLRAQPWARQTVFIAVTGWNRDEAPSAHAPAEFDHRILKPLDPDQLLKLLATRGP